MRETGPVKADRGGLVTAPGQLEEEVLFPSSPAPAVNGFPRASGQLKRPSVPPQVDAEASVDGVGAQAGSSRGSSGWSLVVDNKKASLAEKLSNYSYYYASTVIGLLTAFRLSDIFGWFDPLSLSVKLSVLGLTLLVTLGCGFASLLLVMRKDVAARGEKFVKKVVKRSLFSMIFANVIIFILLFSVIDLSDFFAKTAEAVM